MMDFIRVNSILVALILTLGSTYTEGGATGNLIEDCKFQGDMCAVNGSCIERLRNKSLVENCNALPNPPKKSLYIEESLSFRHHPFTVDNYLANDGTYSVFLSDKLDNLQLVGDCCNMKEDDTCSMPATFDKDKTFLVVFPYKDGRREMYCWSMVDYKDAPIDVCADDGSEIFHPCISFQDGTIKIKARYQPLGREMTKPYDRCYFTGTKDLVQASNDSSKSESLFFLRNSAVNKGDNDSQRIILIEEKKWQCQIRENVTPELHEAVLSDVYNEREGDFVCHAIKLPWEDRYSDRVLCEKMTIMTLTPPIPIVQIAVSVAVVFVLLALIASLKLCRICRKLDKESKIPVVLGVPEEDFNDNKTDTQMISEPKMPEEDCYKIGTGCDDTTSITELKVLQVDVNAEKSSRVENIPHKDQKSEDEEQRQFLKYDSPTKERVSSPSDDSKSRGGSSVDIDQPSVKSNERFVPEPNSENAEYGDGYIPKPKMILPTNPHQREEPEVFTGKISPEYMNVKDDSGFAPNYIVKVLSDDDMVSI